jgi:hypothetical protein
VILAVNNRSVRSVQDLRAEAAKLHGGDAAAHCWWSAAATRSSCPCE